MAWVPFSFYPRHKMIDPRSLLPSYSNSKMTALLPKVLSPTSSEECTCSLSEILLRRKLPAHHPPYPLGHRLAAHIPAGIPTCGILILKQTMGLLSK